MFARLGEEGLWEVDEVDHVFEARVGVQSVFVFTIIWRLGVAACGRGVRRSIHDCVCYPRETQEHCEVDDDSSSPRALGSSLPPWIMLREW